MHVYKYHVYFKVKLDILNVYIRLKFGEEATSNALRATKHLYLIHASPMLV